MLDTGFLTFGEVKEIPNLRTIKMGKKKYLVAFFNYF